MIATQAAQLREARARGEARVVQLNEAVSLHLDDTLRGVDTALKRLRGVYVLDRAMFDPVATELLSAYPSGMFQYITVFGADGRLVYSSNHSRERVFVGDREHFQVHLDPSQDNLFISKPIIGRISGIPLIQCTRAIRQGKRFLGVIGIALRPEYISNELQSLRLDATDLISIVRLDGSIIARSHRLSEALSTKLPPSRPFFGTAPGAKGVFRDISTVDQIPLLFSWQHLSSWPIISAVAINESVELDALYRQFAVARMRTIGAIAIALALAASASWLIFKLGRRSNELAVSEYRNRIFLRNASDGVCICDAGGFVLEASDSFCAMLGYAHGEIIGMNASQWDVRFNSTELRELISNLLNRNMRKFETKHRRKDGTTVAVEVHVEVFEYGADRLLYCSTRDLTERLRYEAALRRSEARHKEAQSIAHLGHWVVDLKAQSLLWSDEMYRVYDISRDLGDITHAACLETVHPDDRAKTETAFESAIRNKSPFALVQRVLLHSGRERFVEVKGQVVLDDGGAPVRCQGTAQDITDLKVAEQRADHLAHFDPLTDLPNRRMLMERLSQTIAAADRFKRAMAVMYVDIDRFKQVNDSFGHDVGDRLLIEVVGRIQGSLRVGDWVARTGGDEFVVVLPEISTTTDSAAVAGRIVESFTRPVAIDGHSLMASVSIGVATYDGYQPIEIDQLLRNADEAMYAVKKAGRGGFCEHSTHGGTSKPAPELTH